MLFAINLDENFVQMPLPIRVCAHPADPVFPDLRGEYRTEPVPPKPHRLVAYVDAAFMQKILHVSELKWKPHVHHHRQFDDLKARLEVLEHVGTCHGETLIQPPARFKLISSDSTQPLALQSHLVGSIMQQDKRPEHRVGRLAPPMYHRIFVHHFR